MNNTTRRNQTLKREATQKLNAIKIIAANPGKHGTELPQQCRRFLRDLELEGKLIYRDGWYVA